MLLFILNMNIALLKASFLCNGRMLRSFSFSSVDLFCSFLF